MAAGGRSLRLHETFWPVDNYSGKAAAMLGPIFRILIVAVSIAIASCSPVVWYWRVVIFFCAMIVLDRLIAGMGVRETHRTYRKGTKTAGDAKSLQENRGAKSGGRWPIPRFRLY
jgi:hypothetical protein